MDKSNVIRGLECCTEAIRACRGCPYNDKCNIYADEVPIELLKDALELMKAPRWHPFNMRPLTEEEKEHYPDWIYILENAPNDEQEILVSNGKCVWFDCYLENGDECYLDSGHDIEEGMAWMALPEPYKGDVWPCGS